MSNNLIIAWLSAKADLARATDAERSLRDSVVSSYSDGRETGTENYPANGGNLKIVSALEYKLPKREETDAVLQQIANMKNADGSPRADAAFIAARLVRWTPELSVSEYKKLADNDPIKALIDRIITTKPKSKQVSFEADKDQG